MFPKRIVYVLLRFHQALHLPQGFETFLLLYSRANFTQLIQSCLLRVVNLHERTFTVGTEILRLARETALHVPQANSRPVEWPQDIKSGDYSGIARRSESKQNIPIMRPGFDSIHTPLFRLTSTVFSYNSSSCGILGVSSPPPNITTAEIAYWVQPRATGWTIRGSTQGSTHPAVGWGPGLLSAVKRPGRGVNPIT